MHAPRRTLTIALLLTIGTVAAGCLDVGERAPEARTDEVPVRVPTAAWRANLTQPLYDAIASTLEYITAADGTQLSLTVHLPEGLAANAQIPTLLEITPYQSFIVPSTSTPVVGLPEPGASWADFVRRGAAYVQADARGTNGSEGCLDFGGENDRQDAIDFVAWIRDQPWSNGVVVTDGVSHPGMGSVVAHAAAPIDAALTHAPVVSYYQDEWLQGARFENQFNGAAYQAVELSPPVYSDPNGITAQGAACTGETVLDFNAPDGRFHALWQERHLARHNAAALESPRPILLTHGFVDLNVHPDHTQLYWDALPADYPKWLVMGWWYHGWPDLDGHPAESFADMRHRWLDATLFGIDNGLFAEPRVLVEDSQGTWHESPTWPLAPSEEVVLRPTQSGAILVDQLEEPTLGVVSYQDRLDAYRGTWTDAHVAFRTDVLDAPRLVNGAPVVQLKATSDTESTKWVAYLMDEAPDGTWDRISHGYVDSHQWNGEADWQPMVPGAPYLWNISLMPTAVVVEAGHRIVLVIASQDSSERVDPIAGRYCFSDHRGGCYDPSGILPAETVGRATNTVFVGGPDGTHVRLHWVDPAATAKPPAAP